MKNKKLTVTIGIPAYNEEANIGNLISSILNQKGRYYFLNKIIVVSDKSTDSTESIVRNFKNQKIVLFRNRVRLGQALSQNKLKNKSKSDVLVLLNADILIPNSNFLEKIIKPFINDANLGMVCPKALPIKATSLFEEIINYSVEMKNSIFESWKNGNNLYTCRGTARAFSQTFFKDFKWPKIVGEDAYTYLSVINKGMTYKYQNDNLIYYKSPTVFVDHRRQSRRFFANYKESQKYFSDSLVRKEFFIPRNIFFKNAIKYFLSNPLLFIAYFTITIVADLTPGKKLKSAWTPSASTKKLIINT